MNWSWITNSVFQIVKSRFVIEIPIPSSFAKILIDSVNVNTKNNIITITGNLLK